jgi:hypothetical protein
VAVGCAVGPSLTGDEAAGVGDTASVWCAAVAGPAGPRVLAEEWGDPTAVLRGLRHWWLGDTCYWPVERRFSARA